MTDATTVGYIEWIYSVVSYSYAIIILEYPQENHATAN